MTVADGTYYSVPGAVSVRWDAENETVVVEWEGWTNSLEFNRLLDAEVKALSEHRALRLLADCRRQRTLNLADQERANREWIPRAIVAGLKRFAIVLPMSDVAAGHIRRRLADIPGNAFEVEYFDSVEEARRWLRG